MRCARCSERPRRATLPLTLSWPLLLPAPQVLIKKQAERARLEALGGEQQRQGKPAFALQRGLAAKLKLQPSVAASRPQGSPAACLSLALPVPGWQEQ